ncbi:MAG: ABC transporter substrate-binding protein, partial [Chloroflexi bacterium]|nr:ABC transporter substrate-binding protein [Chloroflexota bacterium]
MKSAIWIALLALCLAACGGNATPATSSAPASASSSAAAASPAGSSGASSAPAKPGASTSAPAASASASGATSPAASASAALASGGASGSAAAGTPLKVGFITSLTSTFGVIGKAMQAGFQLYMDQAGNKAGGRPIQILIEDEGGDPKVALDKAKKLIEQDKVDVLAGVVLSPSTYAIMDYIEKSAPRKVLLVGTNAGANDMDTKLKSNYFVRTAFSNAQANVPMGSYVFNDLKISKV